MPNSTDSRSLPPRRVAVLPVVFLLAACGGSSDADASRPEVAAAPPPDASTWEVTLTEQAIEPELPRSALFIALSPVNEDTVWIAGATFGDEGRAHYARTFDGGDSWEAGTIPGTEGLEFRDVEAFDGSTVLLMTIGSGDESRIYRTEDAGASWTETFRMDHPDGFIDCFDFWDDDRGILFGDAVDGGLWAATTSDGGRSWTRIPPDQLPEPIGVEGAYAASGTCVDVRGTDEAWVVTTAPRVLHTEDAGASWSVIPTPFAGGGNSIAVRPDGLGYLSGTDTIGGNTAVSRDGGRSWSRSGELAMPRGAYAVTWLPDPDVAVLFAAGPSGVDWSPDGGESWIGLSTENRWAVDFGSPRVGWAIGRPGQVIRIDIDDDPAR